MKRICLMVVLALTLVLPALAHDPRYSSVILRLEEQGVRISITAPAAQATGLARRLALELEGTPATLAPERQVPNPEQRTVLLDTTVATVRPHSVALRHRLFPDDPQSRTLVLLYQNGTLVREEVLDVHHPSFTWSAQQPRTTPVVWGTAWRFLQEGIQHIFTGPDHVLFIVALLFLGGTLRQLAKIVTAFTLSHSVTLCLAATGVLTLSPRLVEPLIALSIVAVGVDNLLAKPGERDIRAAMALGFGLIHGFGFAGALREVGLPREALGVALGTFNLGVELGQLVIVATLAPLLGALSRRSPAAARRALIAGSLTVILLGALWFFQRIG